MAKTVDDIIRDMYPDQDSLFEADPGLREEPDSRAMEILALLQDIWEYLPEESFASLITKVLLIPGEDLDQLDDAETQKRLIMVLRSLQHSS